MNAITSLAATQDSLVLEMCGILDYRRRNWQALYVQTPDGGEDTVEDLALEVYSETHWPCPEEPVRALIALTARSHDAVRAKAAAALAISEAGNYGFECPSEWDLTMSALRDAAGLVPWQIGESV